MIKAPLLYVPMRLRARAGEKGLPPWLEFPSVVIHATFLFRLEFCRNWLLAIFKALAVAVAPPKMTLFQV